MILPVIVGALGYFVDIFDLFLFSVVRIKSLNSLQVDSSHVFEVGVRLLNSQMAGLIIGGFFWGILGDKKGRKKVLFGSILIYSLANVGNSYVSNINEYILLRFIAGFGLAGELGAAISLVAEILPASKRGIGTTVVASFGLLGGIAAALIGEWLPWRQAYLLGGILGFMLLFLRFRLKESMIYQSLDSSEAKRGDLALLFTSASRFQKYLACVLVGLPVYFVSGILITFSPEISKALQIDGVVLASQAGLYSYMGAAIGDLGGGILSQWIKSRKRVIAGSLGFSGILISAYLLNFQGSLFQFYGLCFAVGLGTGYWTVLITLSAEQFGTNLRATVTTTVPNLVRGSVILFTTVFASLHPRLGFLRSAACIAICVVGVAFVALKFLDETYERDIEFVEG